MSHTSKDSVVEQINKAQLIKQPWKHWTVRDILPADILTQLHKDNHFDEWPDSSEKNSLFITTSFDGSASKYTGYRYYFKKDTQSEAALQLVDIFTDSKIVKALSSLTGTSLSNTFLKSCYSRERNGWTLHKHDDHPSTCKLTMIVYLPTEEVPEDNEMGTSLYNQDLTLHHRETYAYNFGSMFVPCSKRFRKTLHGFDGTIIGDRRFVLFQYLTCDGIDMNDPKIPYKYDGVLKRNLLQQTAELGQSDTIDTLWKVNE